MENNNKRPRKMNFTDLEVPEPIKEKLATHYFQAEFKSEESNEEQKLSPFQLETILRNSLFRGRLVCTEGCKADQVSFTLNGNAKKDTRGFSHKCSNGFFVKSSSYRKE